MREREAEGTNDEIDDTHAHTHTRPTDRPDRQSVHKPTPQLTEKEGGWVGSVGGREGTERPTQPATQSLELLLSACLGAEF